jgi:IS30 family transposase
VTFDNGTEFTHHHQLDASPEMKIYFCDRHVPRQKDGIEDAIGMAQANSAQANRPQADQAKRFTAARCAL